MNVKTTTCLLKASKQNSIEMKNNYVENAFGFLKDFNYILTYLREIIGVWYVLILA